MKRRGGRVFLLLGVLLVVVVGAVFLWMSTQEGGGGGFPGLQQPTPAPTPTPVRVVVARRDIEPGTVLVDLNEYVEIGPMPAQEYAKSPDQYFTDVESVYLKLISTTQVIAAGKPIKREYLTSPSISYQEQLPTGQKAVAIPVDAVAGVGHLLAPGDWVDVILMYNMTVSPGPKTGQGDITNLSPFEEAAPKQLVTVKTVIQRAKVVHVITLDLVPGRTPAEHENIVVLAMNDQDAEIVKFAQMDPEAQIHLVARRFDDTGDEFTTGITTKLLIETYGLPVPSPIGIQGDYPVFPFGGGAVP